MSATQPCAVCWTPLCRRIGRKVMACPKCATYNFMQPAAPADLLNACTAPATGLAPSSSLQRTTAVRGAPRPISKPTQTHLRWCQRQFSFEGSK